MSKDEILAKKNKGKVVEVFRTLSDGDLITNLNDFVEASLLNRLIYNCHKIFANERFKNHVSEFNKEDELGEIVRLLDSIEAVSNEKENHELNQKILKLLVKSANLEKTFEVAEKLEIENELK